MGQEWGPLESFYTLIGTKYLRTTLIGDILKVRITVFTVGLYCPEPVTVR